MSIGLGWAEGAFESGSFVAGSWVSATEIRVVCLSKTDGSLYANETVQYAIWADASLASIGAPDLQGTGTTNGIGELVIDATGAFNQNSNVLVAIRQAAGGAGSADDAFGFGADTATYV